MLLAGSAILGPGLLAFSLVAKQAPAFNDTLLLEGVAGGTRQFPLSAMYTNADYLFQVGYGYLLSDTIAPNGLDQAGAPLSFEAAAEHRALAQGYFEQSLRLDPANAHVWQAYAQSLASVTDPEAAMAPLRRSAALSPTTPMLAATRLHLISSLRTWSGDADALADIFDSDLLTLDAHAPGMTARFRAHDAPVQTD